MHYDASSLGVQSEDSQARVAVGHKDDYCQTGKQNPLLCFQFSVRKPRLHQACGE